MNNCSTKLTIEEIEQKLLENFRIYFNNNDDFKCIINRHIIKFNKLYKNKIIETKLKEILFKYYEHLFKVVCLDDILLEKENDKFFQRYIYINYDINKYSNTNWFYNQISILFNDGSEIFIDNNKYYLLHNIFSINDTIEIIKKDNEFLNNSIELIKKDNKSLNNSIETLKYYFKVIIIINCIINFIILYSKGFII